VGWEVTRSGSRSTLQSQSPPVSESSYSAEDESSQLSDNNNDAEDDWDSDGFDKYNLYEIWPKNSDVSTASFTVSEKNYTTDLPVCTLHRTSHQPSAPFASRSKSPATSFRTALIPHPTVRLLPFASSF
jgi:hypothetical protein